MLGIWDYIENKIEVKASVHAHPPRWPSWELENVPPVGASKSPAPSTLDAGVPAAVLLGLGGGDRRTEKFLAKGQSKISPQNSARFEKLFLNHLEKLWDVS